MMPPAGTRAIASGPGRPLLADALRWGPPDIPSGGRRQGPGDGSRREANGGSSFVGLPGHLDPRATGVLTRARLNPAGSVVTEVPKRDAGLFQQ